MTRLADAREIAEQIGLPYTTIARLAAESPAPFTTIRLSRRVLMVDVDQFKAYLAERARLMGEL